LIEGIKERTDSKGQQVVAADPTDVEASLRRLMDEGAESLAICFLWAFANPMNEEIASEVIGRLMPDRFVSVSHVIAPVLGEYERTSTVVLNSALGPVVKNYLGNLTQKLEEFGFKGSLLVAQAYGGLLPLDLATQRPVGMIESGPVSGLVGAHWLGEKIGCSNVIAADMGGTTFKVGVVREGLIEYQPEAMVYRYHFALPKMDITSLGLAGGSIVSLDPRTGVPEIGPRSAGSYPGPVCYDHGGTEPTITDIDAILGYMHAEYFLGGRERLNIAKAEQVFTEKIAQPLGMSTVDAAAAIYKLVNSMIYDLLHKVTVERGIDPRDYALFSFGGTAGMHVASYGEELGVQQIVVPFSAAVHSAFGLVTADVVHEDQLTRVMDAPFDIEAINQTFSDLTNNVARRLQNDGYHGSDMLLERSVDMRYRRQVHVLNVPIRHTGSLDGDVVEATELLFEEFYTGRYGKEAAFREAGTEIVAFRVRGTGVVNKPVLQPESLGSADPSLAMIGRKKAYVASLGRTVEIEGYDFQKLRPGNEVQGPAIVWTPTTTVVMSPTQVARIDRFKNLVIAAE
jgi:N-methylhydantoinase A